MAQERIVSATHVSTSEPSITSIEELWVSQDLNLQLFQESKEQAGEEGDNTALPGDIRPLDLPNLKSETVGDRRTQNVCHASEQTPMSLCRLTSKSNAIGRMPPTVHS